MSNNQNKRPHAPESPKATRPTKRAQTERTTNRPNESQTSIFETSVTMSSTFDAFPEKLRSRLEDEYKSTTDIHMDALQRGRRLVPRYTFSIVRGECDSRSAAEFTLRLYRASFANQSFANMFMLRQFLDECKIPLRNQKFVQLKTQAGLTNKEFVHMHSVRPGEVGWGFDAERCLSLYSAEIDKAMLKKRVFYVERQAVKMEPDVEPVFLEISD